MDHSFGILLGAPTPGARKAELISDPVRLHAGMGM
jgi:hypothetical protein